MKSVIKVGICGFPRSQSVIFTNLRLVEVQATFYKPVLISTAERWRRAAPQDFEFTVKAWQLITHEPGSPTYRKAKLDKLIDTSKVTRYGLFRPTEEVFAAWSATEEICRALDSNKVVFQSPASFKEREANIKNMYDFFRSIDRAEKMMIWEPRGEWKRSTIRAICEDLNLVHCVDPFAELPVSTDFGYLRLHGSPPGKRMYRYSYTEADLQLLYERCSNFSRVYVLFNNYTMYEDALKFKSMLELNTG